MHNKTSSEIATVQTLLEHIELQGVVFSFDVLHAKKIIGQIIVSQNHYLIAIKANQTVFYISSLVTDVAEFARRIREHGHIENRLHW